MSLGDLGMRATSEVTMLIVSCGEQVAITFDPRNPQRGWTFASTRIACMNELGIRAALMSAMAKLGLTASYDRVEFVKAKQQKGVPYSSYMVEVSAEEFAAIPSEGPQGHTIRKVDKSALSRYLDRGRYSMAVHSKTGVTPWQRSSPEVQHLH